MKERPILFSAPMVRAILDGSKTQTRRVVKQLDPKAGAVTTNMHSLPMSCCWAFGGPIILCPYGQPGDRLWVRETFGEFIDTEVINGATYELGRDWVYRADGEGVRVSTRWKPSIHMPRDASRILLEIVSVRVERLHDLSEGDAVAEGIERMPCAVPYTKLWKNYRPGNGCTPSMAIPQNSFRSLWESINGEANWLSNPWVWVVEFKRVQS